MKTRSQIRNVSVTATAALSRDAYAMSHLCAVNLACTHGPAGWACGRMRCCCDRPTIFTRRWHCPSLKFTMPTDPTRSQHWQWSSLL